MPKQKPLIMKSGITGEYYYVTKYTAVDEIHFIADNKRPATKEEIKEYKKSVKEQNARK